jgi:hypothetical protein
MSVERTLYCDEESCECHGSSEAPGWITVKSDGVPARHFCNGDCLFKWAGKHSQPPTTIYMDGTVDDGSNPPDPA